MDFCSPSWCLSPLPGSPSFCALKWKVLSGLCNGTTLVCSLVSVLKFLMLSYYRALEVPLGS